MTILLGDRPTKDLDDPLIFNTAGASSSNHRFFSCQQDTTIIHPTIDIDNLQALPLPRCDPTTTFLNIRSRERQRGRPLDGHANTILPTASHANQPSSTVSPLGLGRVLNPAPPTRPVLRDPAIAAAAALHPQGHILQSPFRTLATSSSNRTRRQPAARLWNPTNSTPRINPSHQRQQQRKRRPSTPPPPSFPIRHPALDTSADVSDPLATGSIDYPLLTLPQLRQIKLSESPGDSIHADRRGSNDRRVSLPSSVRASYDGKYTQGHTPSSREEPVHRRRRDDIGLTILKLEGRSSFIMATETQDIPRAPSPDLEQGPDIMNPRHSTVSVGDGIGSAISSSNSSIMGEEVDPNEEEWGPQHPCFPHMNPHVPIVSPEYASTRIIRIKRDWMIQGDLAPTFSNLYPEILDPAGLSEQEFRRVIEKINGELIPVYNPFGLRNMVDGVLGVFTGWLWDDMGLTSAKSRLNKLENWIENWNVEIAKTLGSNQVSVPPKLISLRRTGYMSLDIQIPDPEIAAAPSHASGAGDSRTALTLEPVTTNA